MRTDSSNISQEYNEPGYLKAARIDICQNNMCLWQHSPQISLLALLTCRKITVMKLIHLLFALLFAVSGFSQALIDRRDCQQIWIATYSNPQGFTGKLLAMDQNSLSIMLSSRSNNQEKYDLVNINITDIKSVSGRDNRSIGKGAWIGALSGAGLGMITGAISGFNNRRDDGHLFNNGTPVFVTVAQYGLIGAITGACIGAAIGAIQWQIPIDGKAKRFENAKNKLENALCLD